MVIVPTVCVADRPQLHNPTLFDPTSELAELQPYGEPYADAKLGVSSRTAVARGVRESEVPKDEPFLLLLLFVCREYQYCSKNSSHKKKLSCRVFILLLSCFSFLGFRGPEEVIQWCLFCFEFDCSFCTITFDVYFCT